MAAAGFAPSQEAVDPETGERYRKCAAAAVLDSSGRLLVGERLRQPGSWNAPQGGMNAEGMESVAEAASRELFEETGLTVEAHVVPVAAQESDEGAERYRAGGWLAEAGLSGQQLHWALFFAADARLDADAARACRLHGLGGEAPEFSQVKWAPLDEVVAQIWAAKRAPYARLQEWARPLVARRGAACASLDFSGTWARDASASVGVAEGLAARGQSAEDAARKAAAPYVQLWERSPEDPLHWFVTTYAADGVTPRRKLLYPTGEWDEEWGHEGAPSGHTAPSTIFGADEGTVRRRTVYLAERSADAGWAHSTLSQTPLGEEESRRYLEGGRMLLRRSFWRSGDPPGSSPATSVEVFVRR